MTVLYPEIEPYDHGMVDVGENQTIYWETSGNPRGKPVIVLHGGPGSGCTPGMRRFFDPRSYRIILFDQRGCGKSRPHASDLSTDLSSNTTWHLLTDMERLRQHLDLTHWMLFGGSWGSTLALAYAEEYPHVVSAIVLWGVAMTRRTEINWLYRDVAPLFPEPWSRFVAGVPEEERAGDLVEAYFRLLHSADPEIRAKAARDFHAWEWALFTTAGERAPDPGSRWLDPNFQLARGRIITHYFRHGAWLEEGRLLAQVHRLAGIPGVMVHGRLDVGSPLKSAWELAQAWSDSELMIVGGAGHSTSDPGMDAALIAATNRFAR
ncbi:MAG TPA: prolyl aminopeptidase [Ktedonobacteraceae bacterium]|nr:prolyl aminopeptidase [Ktedonobacteraceae bacterium]